MLIILHPSLAEGSIQVTLDPLQAQLREVKVTCSIPLIIFQRIDLIPDDFAQPLRYGILVVASVSHNLGRTWKNKRVTLQKSSWTLPLVIDFC
jgi:hypothetical protein